MGVPGTTYYVRTDGNDGQAGTGPLNSQAWQTFYKATQATSAWDTVHFAPGTYTDNTNSLLLASMGLKFLGNTNGSKFYDIGAGAILLNRGPSALSEGLRITANACVVDGIYPYIATVPGLTYGVAITAGAGSVVRNIVAPMSIAINNDDVWTNIFARCNGGTNILVEKCHTLPTDGNWYHGGGSVSVTSSSSAVTVQNCALMPGVATGAVWCELGADDITIINNTILSAGPPIGGGTALRIDATNVTLKNSIMIINTNSGSVYCIDVAAAAQATFTSDYNNIKQVDGSGRLCRWDPDDTDTLSGWQTLSGQDVHTLNVSPVFVDVANGDVHLDTDSPMIDAGIGVGAPSDDYDGVSRPQ